MCRTSGGGKPLAGTFTVGEWTVFPELNSLERCKRTVRVEPKIMQVLLVLCERCGQVVPKEQIFHRVWPDTFVSDEVLTRSVSELRKVFEDNPQEPKYIQTIPKSGYRLMAPVVPEPAKREDRLAGHWKRIATIATILLFAVAACLYTLRVREHAASKAGITSVAVLPLANLSHDPEQEYFADGMTEALINDLSKIQALRVISRTTVMQYKTQHKSLPEIARELKVDAIIEGSVQRSGGRVRITTELIDGQSEAHLWARSFDRDLNDVLMLESDIAQAVTVGIQVKLTTEDGGRIAVPQATSREAHDSYLRGRYLANNKSKGDLEESIKFYQQAIDEDARYAPAYAAMADSYIVMENAGHMSAREANPKIKVAAMTAVALEPNLAEAHMVLASVRESEWDWKGAEQEYKRTIELNPGLARAHHWYAILLSALKRHDEAIAEIGRAVDLEPLIPNLYLVQANTYYLAGRYDQALLVLDAAPLPQLHALSADIEAMVYLRKGDYAKAVSRIQAAVDSQPEDHEALSALGYAYAVAGRNKEALSSLDELQRRSREEYIEPGGVAMIWTALGNKDKALDLLDTDYQLHSSFVMFLATNPAFEPLYSESRFQDLLRRVGLPSDATENK
jgi:TolB-like protein/DNA-binding winged helix-turn-helix (wHTH) protein/Tfp pilus assembly protein PilF